MCIHSGLKCIASKRIAGHWWPRPLVLWAFAAVLILFAILSRMSDKEGFSLRCNLVSWMPDRNLLDKLHDLEIFLNCIEQCWIPLLHLFNLFNYSPNFLPMGHDKHPCLNSGNVWSFSEDSWLVDKQFWDLVLLRQVLSYFALNSFHFHLFTDRRWAEENWASLQQPSEKTEKLHCFVISLCVVSELLNTPNKTEYCE